ncbi:MAG: NTP transferase domain-containing protein [Nitrospiraceae bacterium]|nr:NTP transferase domain-containing protein [Nitrospiraceae bacterium]
MKSWASIILAAGMGTRMRSKIPKVMHYLLGRPLIGYVLGLLKDLDMASKVVVIGHGSDHVRDYLVGHEVELVIQKQQLGTGHAVLCARSALERFCGKILILCGDMPLIKRETLISFMEAHERSGRSLSILTAHMKDPTGYGRVLRSVSDRAEIQGIVEEKDATEAERLVTEVNTGTYAVDSEFLFDALDSIECKNAQGEYYLTDIVGIAASRGVPVGAVSVDSEIEVWGVNSREDLAKAEDIMLDRIRKGWMETGVTFELYRSVYIEPGVILSRDVTIGPHVVLRGGTRVGEGAKLGAFSYLEGVEVPPGTWIPPFSKLINRAGQIRARD